MKLPDYFNRQRIKSVFDALFELEKNGFFELDLNPQSLLFAGDDCLKIYDSRFMYKFNILEDINCHFENNRFHLVERFETKVFFQHLMDVEEHIGINAALKLYKIEKEEAVRIYLRKVDYLMANNGSTTVIQYYKEALRRYRVAIEMMGYLKILYQLEMFRSCCLTVDEAMGMSKVSYDVFKKAKRARTVLHNHYDILKRDGYLYSGSQLNEKAYDNLLREKEIKIKSLIEKEDISHEVRKRESINRAIKKYAQLFI